MTGARSRAAAGMPPEFALNCEDITFAYGAIQVLHDVGLRVPRGEAVCVVGANGAGKTTLARVLGGLARPRTGIVWVDGQQMSANPTTAVRTGVGNVLEGRHLFASQDVRTNLELGAYTSGKPRKHILARMEEIFALFPVLEKRQKQLAGSLSGGEQQMVAIGRALMSTPAVLILDEPSTGLSPKLAHEVFHALKKLQGSGLSMVVVEQNANLAFELASYVYLLREGRVVDEGPVEYMRGTELLREIYLGRGDQTSGASQ